MNTIVDWKKPLEAVRKTDGKVVPVTLRGGPDYNGHYTTYECPNEAETNTLWYADGADRCSRNLWFIRNANGATLDVKQPLQTVDGKAVTYLGKLEDGRIAVQIHHKWPNVPAMELRYPDGRKSARAGVTSGDDVIVKVVKKSVFLNVYADGTVGSTKHKTEEAARHATKFGKVRVAILEQLFENDVQVDARVITPAAKWYRDVRTSGRIATREDYAR